MKFSDLSGTDRKVAIGTSVFGFILIGALTITGLWQFFMHEPNPSYSDYAIGSDRFLVSSGGSGVRGAHTGLGQLSILYGLWVAAFVSVRVMFRASWTIFVPLLAVVASMFTGAFIYFNAVVTDGAIGTDSGYLQIFKPSTELLITNSREIGANPARILILIHVLAFPLVLVAAWRGARRQQLDSTDLVKTNKTSWLDNLPE